MGLAPALRCTLILEQSAAVKKEGDSSSRHKSAWRTKLEERNGVSCHACQNVKEVVCLLRKEDYDLILTDIQMPRTNGFSLLNLLRNSNIGSSRSIPIAAMTARGDEEKENFIKAGFTGCIHKPFSSPELLLFLSSIMEKMNKPESQSIDFRPLI